MYTNKKTVLPSTIVGVTNPYFVAAFSHWPNIIRVGHTRPRGRRSESGAPSPPSSAHASPTLSTRVKQGTVWLTVPIWLVHACVLATCLCLDAKQQALCRRTNRCSVKTRPSFGY